MKKRRKGPKRSMGAPAWVVTYGDMMSLLLTFFVLLVSLSSIDAEKYRQLRDSLREAFGSQSVEDLMQNASAQQTISPLSGGEPERDLKDELLSIIPQSFPGALPDRFEGKSVLISVPGKLLFESGRDELKPVMKPHLEKLARYLLQKPHLELQVEGHTDSVPINTTRFRSNWELSAARALAVVHFLLDEGVPSTQLAAVGNGEGKPVADNESEESRELNRRVEFRFFDRASSQPAEWSQLPLTDLP